MSTKGLIRMFIAAVCQSSKPEASPSVVKWINYNIAHMRIRDGNGKERHSTIRSSGNQSHKHAEQKQPTKIRSCACFTWIYCCVTNLGSQNNVFFFFKTVWNSWIWLQIWWGRLKSPRRPHSRIWFFSRWPWSPSWQISEQHFEGESEAARPLKPPAAQAAQLRFPVSQTKGKDQCRFKGWEIGPIHWDHQLTLKGSHTQGWARSRPHLPSVT